VFVFWTKVSFSFCNNRKFSQCPQSLNLGFRVAIHIIMNIRHHLRKLKFDVVEVLMQFLVSQ
jgi:hypothetical protein